MNVAGEHAFGEKGLVLLRPVSGVGPHAEAGVVLANRLGPPLIVVGIGGAGVPGADQTMVAVDADMIVAEHRDGKIDRLERLGIGALVHLDLGVLDASARIAPSAWPGAACRPRTLALLVSRLLGHGAPLLGCRHDRGADDLSTYGEIAPLDGQSWTSRRPLFRCRTTFVLSIEGSLLRRATWPNPQSGMRRYKRATAPRDAHTTRS